MSTCPLSEDAVGRIVAAVNKEPRDRAALADLLGEARFEYLCRRIPDVEHTASKQRGALADLQAALKKFGRSLEQYKFEGQPGWGLVASAAQVHLESLRKQRQILNEKLPTTDRSGEQLQATIRKIDQAIFFHDHHPSELLNRMVRGAAALDAWLSLLFQSTQQGELIVSQRGEKGEAHITAERWLICTAIPDIYQRAFSPRSMGRRATLNPNTKKPSGARLAFTRSTLREFGVKTANGSFLSDYMIDEYWRGPRRRRGVERGTTSKIEGSPPD
jgi:hypothetical protein